MDTKDSKNLFMVAFGFCLVLCIFGTVAVYLYQIATGVAVNQAFAAIANIAIGSGLTALGNLGKEWMASKA